MLTLSRDFLFCSPVWIVFFTTIVVMMLDLFKSDSKATSISALLGLITALLLTYLLYPNVQASVWSGLFIVDHATLLLQFFILLTVGLSIYFSLGRLSHMDSTQGDIISLYLLSTIGMMSLVAAQNFLSIYMSLELTSLPLYALVASQKRDGLAIEASVKYFIMGAIASVFILFGISMLYGLTGHLNLNSVATILSKNVSSQSMMILFAMVFIIIGASFKLALVPFHMWIPDVYCGANPVMTLFLSAAPKIAGFAIFLRLALTGFFELVPVIDHILLLLALASIVIGNLAALIQKDIRRLLAYSTISHMGYILLGFASGEHVGETAALFYILVYALMSVAAFSALILCKSQSIFLLNISDLEGLNKRAPWLAAMLMIVFFSMAGVPPAIGFFAKFFIIQSLIDAKMYSIAIVALIFAVIGAFYYLRLIKSMYFDDVNESMNSFEIATGPKFIYIVQSFSLLLLGLCPNLLINACWQAL